MPYHSLLLLIVPLGAFGSRSLCFVPELQLRIYDNAMATPPFPLLLRFHHLGKHLHSSSGRRVTFTKRRTGLFDKAAELCVLCGANVAILIFSEGGKAFCFGNLNVESVMEGYLTKSNPEEIIQRSESYNGRPIIDSAR
ncbi:hypothetical protein SAY86_028549 [Trapa natans]|uniref:MADS-box domain-containing protein n=1 Tax=Trapa natans TaxID=22666 RepID=A0AAN7MIN4_TRANT|nr:hypothetical protein SAY86_028549 [Trapa natans]